MVKQYLINEDCVFPEGNYILIETERVKLFSNSKVKPLNMRWWVLLHSVSSLKISLSLHYIMVE